MKEISNPFEILVTHLTSMQEKIDSLRQECLPIKPAPINNFDDLISTKEVCQRLSISRVTVWNWEKKNILHPIRFGNSKRFRLADIEALSRGKKQ